VESRDHNNGENRLGQTSHIRKDKQERKLRRMSFGKTERHMERLGFEINQIK
jgi:hypothetical protein